MQERITDIRKELSALAEIKIDDRKTQNIKRNRLLKKYSTEKKEKLDQLIEDIRQKVAAKTQRLSRYRKRQNWYYQNRMFRRACKKLYNLFSQTNYSVQYASNKRGNRELLEKNIQRKGSV